MATTSRPREKITDLLVAEIFERIPPSFLWNAADFESRQKIPDLVARVTAPLTGFTVYFSLHTRHFWWNDAQVKRIMAQKLAVHEDTMNRRFRVYGGTAGEWCAQQVSRWVIAASPRRGRLVNYIRVRQIWSLLESFKQFFGLQLFQKFVRMYRMFVSRKFVSREFSVYIYIYTVLNALP